MQVLVVDDSAVYRKLIGDHLQSWGFGITMAETGAQAWRILEQPDAPKLVLLDWVLPDLEGTELCQRICKTSANGNYIYVILLTGKQGREHMLDAMRAGADDYLVKPFDASELKARLLVGERILNLQEELVAARESMRDAATHDSLTGLLNRGEIFNMLEKELERSRREKTVLSIILADIDHFKKVNDTCGHQFGDSVLQEVARRLHSRLRIYDGVGRYGGEEFLLVLPSCNLEGALARATELRDAIGSAPVVVGNVERSITVSLGVAVSKGSGAKDLEQLLSRADAALYLAKENGRNRVEYMEDSARKAARAHKATAPQPA